MSSLCLFVHMFVSLLAGLCKKDCSTKFFTKLGEMMEHAWKKPLDFVGNLDHVTLRLWLE